MNESRSLRGQIGTSARGFNVGETPVVPLPTIADRLGIAELWCKAEYLQPTGSYKDRTALRACEIARERNLTGLLGTSSGNGAAAAAAFGARAGLDVCILTVPGAPTAKLATARAHGAQVIPVHGLGWTPDDTRRVLADVVAIANRLEMYPFITAWRYAPEAMAGASNIATELASQLPQLDSVYVPVGGGGLLTSVHRGYSDAGPRLIGVEPQGSATLERACRGDLQPRADVSTTVSGFAGS